MSEKDNQQRERKRTPNNRTTTGFRISDELWVVLQPLLPVHINRHRFGGGRPRVSDRRCADAIFYVLRTGCQWQALDQTELCAHSTAHDRFQVWVEVGVFLKLWQAGIKQFDDLCGIEWDWLAMSLIAAFPDAICYIGEPFNTAAHKSGRVQAQQVSTACTRKIIQ